MQVVIFTHPDFLRSQSMPLFANMIFQGLIERGHFVVIWKPEPFLYLLPFPSFIRKWLGYLDQYIFFPLQAFFRLRNTSTDTLFVFADQALGPWVPLVNHRPHVIHCHDFMALRSALGEFSQNPTGWTGRLYQQFIKWGFANGKNFISVSENTQKDLHRFINAPQSLSKVVYNGLNYPYVPMLTDIAHNKLQAAGVNVPDKGFLMHIGGNQWYKNRAGVIMIYKAYCQLQSNPLPLYMIGQDPTPALLQLASEVAIPGEVKFINGLANDAVHAAYSISNALIFPSLAEGFGWPIAEALACGCPVLTTKSAPMTEVGGDAASYIPILPASGERSQWAQHSAEILIKLLNEDPVNKASRKQLGLKQVQKFSTQLALDSYEAIYKELLN